MPMTQDSRLQFEIFPRAVVVDLLDSRLTDLTHIETVSQQLNDLIDRHGQVRVVLSLARVNFMASFMLAKFVKYQERLQKLGGRLALCSLDPSLTDIIGKCGMKKTFHVYKNEAEALKSF